MLVPSTACGSSSAWPWPHADDPLAGHGPRRVLGAGAAGTTHADDRTTDAHLRRLRGVPPVSRRDLRSLEGDADGERRARSEAAPRRDHPGPVEAGSARHVRRRRHRVRLRQPVEAALLQARRRRLLSAARAVGRRAQDVAAVSRARRHGLVGPVLRQGQPRAPDRPVVRRLPLGRLRRPRRRRVDRMERRLREVPRPRRRSRARAEPREHHQPGEARSGRRERRLHPVSLAGPPARRTRSRAGRTTGRSAFASGSPLRDFWQLEDHTLGETTFTHFADGTGHKNRMQGNDFVQSVMYSHGVTCASCHDVHGTAEPGAPRAPANEVCGQCHAPGGPNGPRAKTLEAHTHHRAGSPGSECVACHMPKIEQTIGDVMVRSHTFRFIAAER